MLASALGDVHTDFSWVVVFSNAAAAVWALAAVRFEQVRGRALWIFTIVAQVTIFVQVVLGVALMQAEDIEPPGLHIFYGFLALIVVALMYSYRQQVEGKRRLLLYGGGGLFLMGLAIRAMFLGGPAI